MKIDITLNNRSRLNLAEWAVWAADFPTVNRLGSHRIINVVWINPNDLSVYLNIDDIEKEALEVAEQRNLLNISELHNWKKSWRNVDSCTIVPIRHLIRGYIDHDLSSRKDNFQIINIFQNWLEKNGRNLDDVYEEHYQKTGISLIRPSEWEIIHTYNDDDCNNNWNNNYTTFDNFIENEQFLKFLLEDSVYSKVIEKIKSDSYHLAVKTAMELIVSVYDTDIYL